MASAPTHYEYDMGYSADEFGNTLNGNFSGVDAPYDCEALKPHRWKLSHKHSAMTVEVRVSKLPERVLGAISLPVLRVIFDVKEGSGQQVQDFFDRFFKYFHKGGG